MNVLNAKRIVINGFKNAVATRALEEQEPETLLNTGQSTSDLGAWRIFQMHQRGIPDCCTARVFSLCFRRQRDSSQGRRTRPISQLCRLAHVLIPRKSLVSHQHHRTATFGSTILGHKKIPTDAVLFRRIKSGICRKRVQMQGGGSHRKEPHSAELSTADMKTV